jgi:pyruvate dehydrogenase E1 component beta subunit
VIEHKALYGTKGGVPNGDYEVPFGQAAVRREGDDLTIVTYSRTVRTALDAAEELSDQGVEAEVIDLRTVMPIDWETITSSVERTGRLLVVHEGHRRAGVGAEIAAEIGTRCWDKLEAPITRVCGLDIPVPYAEALERHWMPQIEDVVSAAQASVDQ